MEFLDFRMHMRMRQTWSCSQFVFENTLFSCLSILRIEQNNTDKPVRSRVTNIICKQKTILELKLEMVKKIHIYLYLFIRLVALLPLYSCVMCAQAALSLLIIVIVGVFRILSNALFPWKWLCVWVRVFKYIIISSACAESCVSPRDTRWQGMTLCVLFQTLEYCIHTVYAIFRPPRHSRRQPLLLQELFSKSQTHVCTSSRMWLSALLLFLLSLKQNIHSIHTCQKIHWHSQKCEYANETKNDK